MYLLKFGAYGCIVAGGVLLVLAVAIPEARLGLIIGSAACFGAAAFDLWLVSFLSPVMKKLPKPAGMEDEDITSLRGSMKIGRAMREQNLEKMKTGTELLRQMNLANELQAHGLQARVEVLSMRDTGQLINFDPVLEFDLRVQPGDGELYHVSGHRQIISKIIMPQIDIGGSYSAFVSPDDPNSLFITWQ